MTIHIDSDSSSVMIIIIVVASVMVALALVGITWGIIKYRINLKRAKELEESYRLFKDEKYDLLLDDGSTKSGLTFVTTQVKWKGKSSRFIKMSQSTLVTHKHYFVFVFAEGKVALNRINIITRLSDNSKAVVSDNRLQSE